MGSSTRAIEDAIAEHGSLDNYLKWLDESGPGIQLDKPRWPAKPDRLDHIVFPSSKMDWTHHLTRPGNGVHVVELHVRDDHWLRNEEVSDDEKYRKFQELLLGSWPPKNMQE